jgi:hypothetical protein
MRSFAPHILERSGGIIQEARREAVETGGFDAGAERSSMIWLPGALHRSASGRTLLASKVRATRGRGTSRCHCTGCTSAVQPCEPRSARFPCILDTFCRSGWSRCHGRGRRPMPHPFSCSADPAIPCRDIRCRCRNSWAFLLSLAFRIPPSSHSCTRSMASGRAARRAGVNS